MTPEELAANSPAIQQAFADLGITPEEALLHEGRQRAWGRFGPALQRAMDRRQDGRVAAIAARVERDATTHARSELARMQAPAPTPVPAVMPDASELMAGIGRLATPQAATPAEPPNRLLAVAGGNYDPNLTTQDLIGPAPQPMRPTMTGIENQPPPAPAPAPQRFAVRNALMPQSPEEEADLQSNARSFGRLLEWTGAAPAYRAGQHAAAGRPLEAAANAGVAMLPYRPVAGVMTMGAALGGGLASDLTGMFTTPTAMAQTEPPATDPQTRIQQIDTQVAKLKNDLKNLASRTRDSDRLYTLSQPINLELQQLSSERTQLQTLIGSAAQTQQTEAARARQIEQDAEDRRRQQEQEALGRALARAEEARARERARDRSFDTSRVGQIWNEAAGFAPMAVGGVTGAALRAARPSQPLWKNLAESTGSGALAYNIPLGFDAYGTPFLNPHRQGEEAYARELPLGNPLRTQTEEYARTLPVANPLREAASREFWDPGQIVKRMGFGATEGLVGGGLGVAGVEIGGRIYNALFGRGRAGPPPPGTPPSSPPTGPAAPTPQTTAPTPTGATPTSPRPSPPAPNAPLEPGVTAFRNPATGEIRRLDAAGRWQGPRRGGHGYSRPPDPTWERISEVSGRNALLG